MDCGHIEREGTIEAYLGGRLPAAERSLLEKHIFACPRCLERLQVVRAVQEELWRETPPAGDAAPREASVQLRRWGFAGLAALALAVVVGALLWQFGGRPDRRAAEEGPSAWASLAAFEPPIYLPLALRGEGNEAAERFQAGMEAYQAGRYHGAIRELRAVPADGPQTAPAWFFLGICYLLTGQTDEGIDSLEDTVSLGDSSFQNEARFYLAKAWLGKRDVARARAELEAVVASGHRLAEEAVRLLAMMGH